MKNIYIIFFAIAILISVYFAGVAYLSFIDENMDKVYLNVGYCALFLSGAIYTLHLNEQKTNN
ncbi:protein YpmT [Metabacillus arenae]|uniref:Protein YpmT n=1 Tax=Metabacillus arenae TaxID=2771434 RepID=A0A926RX80_9BACI|nr:protein YpmT [Metabacillus arenae]MBD1381588.1 protein YpmT [Metabacillus arenae]